MHTRGLTLICACVNTHTDRKCSGMHDRAQNNPVHFYFLSLSFSSISRSFGVQFIYIRIIFSCFSISLHASRFLIDVSCQSASSLCSEFIFVCRPAYIFNFFCCCLNVERMTSYRNIYIHI